MIDIDGSYGEGGGQVLRTSLSLAAITGEPIRIAGIRAGRRKPGLAAQHLTAVRAAARICHGELQGDALGSTMLEFIPGGGVKAGNYIFDVSEVQQGGSAGAITLVLQTILLPLALADGDSHITLRGGTHVIFSPTVTYIERVYLPMLCRMGIKAQVKLGAWGWYPRGGGEVNLQVKGGCQLCGLNLLERGELKRVQGLAVATELPAHIPQRMANRAENLLRTAGLRVSMQALREKGVAPGAGIFLTAEYCNSLTGFGGFGRLRLSSEKVAEIACGQLLQFHETGAPVDEHLADQLLLPAALASESSQYRVAEVSTHLTTNAAVIEKFGLGKITVNQAERVVAIASDKT
ncbi:RNA 3'-terminal phosphate cyclase [Trichormus variabilis ATCC 29413]|uniref:RNA 3'-terminal phosphate cyclase n=2 Tax=Anabaena variabilis TaxID=264691 RepID=RTCA_TRIV2|nr:MULTISPECIES: RNA 3'-terminal phosphate cyclase [Nostocaceae]Q3M6L1.1 RecName: Full=RNA 3'-terminal phosphate cyclase; Short=RNA cyclase; Short=RNA-3'-phosphate cyclase [Trichormus variabilis ATCC 29413]ABA23375.1 RNA 3'-terminal phosphate cyclase [Trichormus variabilis ATCC 29413]MBC1215121.1 RNA 3'-phosphate cyclase [Trichormus variabilis ARAD]MBC1256789.1 RNA 3'-phosphate cyclase [Trichormus variabilis V5]MBC1269745.1 RNA 3'-phosphate cyclase [Trichormus variabilis FSR]MBC1303790.1 RNA 